jgi:hypothetical protein
MWKISKTGGNSENWGEIGGQNWENGKYVDEYLHDMTQLFQIRWRGTVCLYSAFDRYVYVYTGVYV